MSMASFALPLGQVSLMDLKNIIAKNLGTSEQFNHQSMNGLLSGVFSRFEPGVHWVDETYQVIPESADIIHNQRFTVTPGLNIPGINNLSPLHLIANYKRVFRSGYDLERSKVNLRHCDVSNYHVANIVHECFENTVIPELNNSHDKVITVNLTTDSNKCVEANGLAIYAPPGSGKTFAAESLLCRYIDTDFVYDPDVELMNYMTNIKPIIFTNDYILVIPHIPTVAFIPNKDVAIDRIASKLPKSVDVIDSWMDHLNEFVRTIVNKQDSIIERDECVVLVRVSSDNFYVKNIMRLLCRQ